MIHAMAININTYHLRCKKRLLFCINCRLQTNFKIYDQVNLLFWYLFQCFLIYCPQPQRELEMAKNINREFSIAINGIFCGNKPARFQFSSRFVSSHLIGGKAPWQVQVVCWCIRSRREWETLLVSFTRVIQIIGKWIAAVTFILVTLNVGGYDFPLS